MTKFPRFKGGMDFVKKMVEEESVFCLPGEVHNFFISHSFNKKINVQLIFVRTFIKL